MMKRFLKITTAILLLLFVSFWGYISYQQKASYRTPIHRQASGLVRVDVYRIYRSLLGDYFKGRTRKETTPVKGLDIPANIFLFTVKGQLPSIVYGSLAIHDYDRFIRSLPLSWKDIGTTGLLTAQSPDGHWQVVCSRQRVAFAWSMKGMAAPDILQDLALERNTQMVIESPFQKIKEQEGHITWTDGHSSVVMTFERGRIRASGLFEQPSLAVPAQVQHYATPPGAALHAWLYMDMKPLLAGRIFQNDSLLLSGDSLLAGHLQGLELIITDPVLQRDSVVTYAYNDDFEKVAVATIKESRVPGIMLTSLLDVDLVYPYLQRQYAIDDSNKVSPACFPLYQLYARTDTGILQLSTLKKERPMLNRIAATDFFHLDIDFDRLKKQPELAPMLRYTTKLRKLEAVAHKNKEGKIQAEAVLYLQDADQQALLQLYKGL